MYVYNNMFFLLCKTAGFPRSVHLVQPLIVFINSVLFLVNVKVSVYF